jgi:hypothetical protein
MKGTKRDVKNTQGIYQKREASFYKGYIGIPGLYLHMVCQKYNLIVKQYSVT